MVDDLKHLLEKELKGTLYFDTIASLMSYYQLIGEASRRQNLTRILTAQEFFLRHVYDCLELLKTNWLEYPAVDLGSGVGVPGLLTALLTGPLETEEAVWVLVESEKKKHNF